MTIPSKIDDFEGSAPGYAVAKGAHDDNWQSRSAIRSAPAGHCNYAIS
jgi:hypothetical protein